MMRKVRILAVCGLAATLVGGCADPAVGPLEKPAVHLNTASGYDAVVVLDDAGHSVTVNGPSTDWAQVPLIGTWTPPVLSPDPPNCDSLRVEFYAARDLFDEGWSLYWKGLLAKDFFGDMAEGKEKMQEGFRRMVAAKQELEYNGCITPPAGTPSALLEVRMS